MIIEKYKNRDINIACGYGYGDFIISGEVYIIISGVFPKNSKQRLLFKIVLKGMGFKIIFWPDEICQPEFYIENLQQMGIEVVYENPI